MNVVLEFVGQISIFVYVLVTYQKFHILSSSTAQRSLVSYCLLWVTHPWIVWSTLGGATSRPFSLEALWKNLFPAHLGFRQNSVVWACGTKGLMFQLRENEEFFAPSRNCQLSSFLELFLHFQSQEKFNFWTSICHGLNRNLRNMHKRILCSSGNNPVEWMTVWWREEVPKAQKRAEKQIRAEI